MEKGAISVSRAELGDVADLLAILNGATQYKVERGLHPGLAVESSVHGQGIGAMVIEWALHQTFLQGRQFLRLDCSARNAGLCRYYERQGFIQVGQRVLQSGYIAALYQCEASHC